MRMEAVIKSVKTILELSTASAIQDLGKLKMERPVMLWVRPTQQQVQSSSSQKDPLKPLRILTDSTGKIHLALTQGMMVSLKNENAGMLSLGQ